jgi:hypothetical protein
MPDFNQDFFHGLACGYLASALIALIVILARPTFRKAPRVLVKHPATLVLLFSTQQLLGSIFIMLAIAVSPYRPATNDDWQVGARSGAFGLPGITVAALLSINMCQRRKRPASQTT